ncbi:class I SAM-dependent methyltransferase [Bizionia myxarmorum]|nr:class I SAM-dependent methyltransferase [Bizionia myxarmorum]
MKKRDLLNYFAFQYSKRKLKASFNLKSFDAIYGFTQTYVGRGYYDRISLHQYKGEFEAFAEYVAKTKPKVVVEIGTKKGGSLYMWARYFKPKHLISIDLPGGIHGGGYPKQKRPFYECFLDDEKASKISLIQGDSHANKTLEELKRLLNGEKIDFLFIDGDHRYEGVKQDFDMYKDLMNSGGLIGFHDIVASDYHHNMQCYVDKLWDELILEYKHKAFVQDPAQHKYGLGIVVMP